MTILAWRLVDASTNGLQDKYLGNVLGDLVVLVAAAIAVIFLTETLLLRPRFSLQWQSMYDDGRAGEILHGPRETIHLPASGQWQSIVSVSYSAPSLFGKAVTTILRRSGWYLEIHYDPPIGYEVHHEQVRSFEKERIPGGRPGIQLALRGLSESREAGRMSVSIRPDLTLGRQPIDVGFLVVRRLGRGWGLRYAVRVDSDIVWLDFI